MSPWTALLESLHSALIDELTDRHPEPKPELGMPQRHREIALPAPGLQTALICEVIFTADTPGAAAAVPSAGAALSGKSGNAAASEVRGFALFAADPECAAKLEADSRKLWDALIKRAGKEFMFRGIKPRLGNPLELKTAELPKGFAVPARVIWIPFRLNPGCCYLGVGA